jgi:hypothetical protein
MMKPGGHKPPIMLLSCGAVPWRCSAFYLILSSLLYGELDGTICNHFISPTWNTTTLPFSVPAKSLR